MFWETHFKTDDKGCLCYYAGRQPSAQAARIPHPEDNILIFPHLFTDHGETSFAGRQICLNAVFSKKRSETRQLLLKT